MWLGNVTTPGSGPAGGGGGGGGAAQQLGSEFGPPPAPTETLIRSSAEVTGGRRWGVSGAPGPECGAICGRVVKSKEKAAKAQASQPSDYRQLTSLDTGNPQARSPSSSSSKSLFSWSPRHSPCLGALGPLKAELRLVCFHPRQPQLHFLLTPTFCPPPAHPATPASPAPATRNCRFLQVGGRPLLPSS